MTSDVEVPSQSQSVTTQPNQLTSPGNTDDLLQTEEEEPPLVPPYDPIYSVPQPSNERNSPVSHSNSITSSPQGDTQPLSATTVPSTDGAPSDGTDPIQDLLDLTTPPSATSDLMGLDDLQTATEQALSSGSTQPN